MPIGAVDQAKGGKRRPLIHFVPCGDNFSILAAVKEPVRGKEWRGCPDVPTTPTPSPPSSLSTSPSSSAPSSSSAPPSPPPPLPPVKNSAPTPPPTVVILMVTMLLGYPVSQKSNVLPRPNVTPENAWLSVKTRRAPSGHIAGMRGSMVLQATAMHEIVSALPPPP